MIRSRLAILGFPDTTCHLSRDSLNTGFRLVVGIEMIDVLGEESCRRRTSQEQIAIFSKAKPGRLASDVLIRCNL